MVSKGVLIGGAVAGAVGIGAVALWFMSRPVTAEVSRDGGQERSCKEWDYTQNPPWNNPQWQDSHVWQLSEVYHGVRIYKNVAEFKQSPPYPAGTKNPSFGTYAVWLGKWTDHSQLQPQMSGAVSIQDVKQMIDEFCARGGSYSAPEPMPMSRSPPCVWC